LENKYYIKNNYISNLEPETIETEDNIYWTEQRINQSYYTRYFLYKFCKKFIIQNKISSVLDIGCGSAIKLMKFIYPVCHNVYGIDQERIVKFNRKKYKINTFYADDIEDSKLNLEKKFDLIISCDVIEHLVNPDKLLSYIKKYSHNNSYIFITTPDRDILRGKNCSHSPKKSHVREWNFKEFNNYINSHSFNIIYHDLIDNFRVWPNLINKIPQIKRDFISLLYKVRHFNNLKKIKHTQLVGISLNNSKIADNEYLKQFINQNLNQKKRDFFTEVVILFYLSIINLYKIMKRILK